LELLSIHLNSEEKITKNSIHVLFGVQLSKIAEESKHPIITVKGQGGVEKRPPQPRKTRATALNPDNQTTLSDHQIKSIL